MKLIVEVINLPEMEPLHGAELMGSLRAAVIGELDHFGFPFGSGYSVWGFYE